MNTVTASLLVRYKARVEEAKIHLNPEDIEEYVRHLEREIHQLRSLCGAAYQVVGAADGPVEMLDNLSAAASDWRLPHDTSAGLPWVHKSDLGGSL